MFAVLDIKDRNSCYFNREEIEQAEQQILERLSADCSEIKSPTGQVNDIFKSNKVHFVIKEGSLKVDILSSNILKQEHVDFFSEGHGAALCQLTEFFMNAAKFGDIVMSDPALNLSSYVTPLQAELVFTPVDRSYVAYPPSYKAMAMHGEYATAMKGSEMFHARVCEDAGGGVLGKFKPVR